jgi:hypothetical protein
MVKASLSAATWKLLEPLMRNGIANTLKGKKIAVDIVIDAWQLQKVLRSRNFALGRRREFSQGSPREM